MDTTKNIADYDYFLNLPNESLDPIPSADGTLGLQGRDSLVFDDKTQTYTKYRIVEGKKAVVLYTGVPLKEMLAKEGSTSEKNYLLDKFNALEKLFEFKVPTLYAEKSLYNRILQNSYADAPELSGHITDLVDDIGRSVKQIKDLKYKKLKDVLPNLVVGFGGTFSLQAGYRRQEIANLSLPQSLRVTGSPDFQVSMDVKGDLALSNKLILPLLSLNNLSNFQEELFKASLQYKGNSEEIIKEVSMIQTNFNTQSSLIPSTESLLGAKMKMQFGRLFITGAIGQVRSQIQTKQIENGKGRTRFKLNASDYEDNQHFFLAQYFYDNFEKSIQDLPVIQSGVRITRLEVWITNRQNQTQEVRQGIAFMDMGEPQPYNDAITPLTSSDFPFNEANSLYATLDNNVNYRNTSDAEGLLFSNGLNGIIDYEKFYMRRLDASEYYLNDELGYIMLNSPLQSDQVLGIAFEYSVNGRIYQVGEFSNEQTPRDRQTGAATSDYTTATLFLKLLKATALNTRLPIWNLMMKNVYSVGYGIKSKEDLSFQILYEQSGGIAKNYIPHEGIATAYEGVALLELTKMDVLNSNEQKGSDGEFDFIDKITFISEQGKIVFPHNRPFDDGLRYVFGNDPAASNYLFSLLYDTIKTIAKTYTNLDKFIISGESSSSFSGNGNIRIGFNLRPGSVKLYSGSKLLVENQDYIADYNLGTVRIINPLYINAQLPINIQYENNNQFNFRNYLLMGLRWDYYFKNKKWMLGGTLVNLNETPFYRKLEYGNDPINNSVFQIDLKYKDEMPWLSKALSLFPDVQKEAISSIRAETELAVLVPGHSSQIGQGSGGGIFIDDFEAVRSTIDVKSSFGKWVLASTPEGSVDENNNLLFTEASLKNDLKYGFGRAHLSWYVLDPFYQNPDRLDNPFVGNYEELLKPEVRQVYLNELFPNRTIDILQNRLSTFDITYFPRERGPYNFDTKVSSFNPDGTFIRPEEKWAGIMRSLNQVDFVSTNIEYLEFWLLDPFSSKLQSDGGSMYIQLGNISEDILKDGHKFYENGLSTPSIPTITDQSVWGDYPTNPSQINFSFNNNPGERQFQDVGFDGLNQTQEQEKFIPFLNEIATNFGAGTDIYRNLFRDPSSDDYRHYTIVEDEFGNQTTLLDQYKFISNPDGNSPAATSSTIQGSFLPPDSEDINRDNILNENESYFQYRIDFEPNMQVGNSHIVDKKVVDVDLPNGTKRSENWYLFRIPIKSYDHKYGSIEGFQSIRFMRLFFNGFKDTSVTFRFATMQFVLNQWRIFTNALDTIGGLKAQEQSPATFFLQTVNIEENERKTPVPYIIPPKVQRQSNVSPTSGTYLQNEQSQSVVFSGLPPGQSRGIFKGLNFDFRNYERLKMFIHAEGNTIQEGSLYALIRIGTDLVSNYYEIKIPLDITPDGASTAFEVWPDKNLLDILLSTIVNVKRNRDISGFSSSKYYSETQANGMIISILGEPSMATVNNILIGVHNSSNAVSAATGEIWFNELRLTGLNETPSWASTANLNIKFADLGNVNITGSYKSIGWGSLEQRLNQRMQEDDRQIALVSNIDIHRLLPRSLGVQIPMYISYNEQVKQPKYYPHSSDVLLSEVLNKASNKDSIIRQSVTYTSNYRISFPSVVFFKNTPKWFPLSPSLFTFNYAYSDYFTYSPTIDRYSKVTHQGGVNYHYNVPIGNFEPFKKIKLKAKNLRFISQFNFRFLPSSINFRLSFDRLFSKKINRNIDAFQGKNRPYFNKYLKFTKVLNVKWPLTKSLQLDYLARQESFVDEPYGDLDTKIKLDSFWNRALNLGNNNFFTQTFGASYTLPFKLFPALDWISADVNYNSTYSWKLNVVNIGGDDIKNTQRIGASLNLNFTNLYYKFSKYRREITPRSFDPLSKKLKSVFLQLLTMVRSVTFFYSENLGTNLPGWAPNVNTWGKSFDAFNPGLDFIFGYTPSLDWFKNTLVSNKWLISNPLLSKSTIQQYQQSVNFNISLLPIRDLRIEIKFQQDFTKNRSLLIKDIDGNNNFQVLDPTSTGSFSTSYLSFTLFNGLSESNLLDVANRLGENRKILSKRLAESNPYATGDVRQDGYYDGYDLYAQDVIIPSFIAAFSNTAAEDAPYIRQTLNKLRDNPFLGFPLLPNWKITYSGLTRIPAIKKIFSSLTLSHSYSSKLDMSTYNSSLKFMDPLNIGWPSFIDPNSGNYIPYFLVPNVSVTEEYNPLIAIQGVIFSRWQFASSIKRTRQSILSLSDYQISEANIFGVNVRLNWVSKEFNLPFSMHFDSEKPSKGNLTLGSTVTIENNKKQNIRMDENVLITTSGLDKFDLNITAGLIIDNILNVQIYFQQLNSYPQLSSAPPIFMTRVGLNLVLTVDYDKQINPTTILPKGIADFAPMGEAIDAVVK